MKRKLTLAVSYCAIALIAISVATSCKKDPVNGEGPGNRPKPNDTIASIAIFSADSVVLADTLRFEPEAPGITFIVDANIKGWTAAISDTDGSTVEWAQCTPLVGPSGRTEVAVSVTNNDIELERVCTITFTQDSTGLTQSVALAQKGIPALLTDRSTDSLALIALYKAFDGRNLFPDLWDLKKELQHWEGVKIDSLPDGTPIAGGRVIGLVFENQDAKGEIPTELGNLRELKSLTLTLNRVKGAVPNSLSFIKGLKKMSLKGSWGITSLPKDIGLISDLEVLDIEGTSVAELPESLSRCEKLKELNAASFYEKVKEKLKGDLSKILVNKPALKQVVLGTTELTGDLSFLKHAPNMTKFTIESHKMSGDLNLTQHLNYPTADSMRTFSLGSSPEFTGTLAGLNQFDSLETFSILDSKVAGTLDDMKIHTLENFYSVNIVNNDITGNISFDFINSLKTLSSVGMNKLEGTLAPEVVAQIFEKFNYGENVCVQKEGFGFTNCELAD